MSFPVHQMPNWSGCHCHADTAWAFGQTVGRSGKRSVGTPRPGSAKGRAPPKPEAPAPDHGFLMDGKTAARDMYDGEFPHGFDLIFAG